MTEISDEYGIHPTQFYKWQKVFFDRALEGFRGSSQGRSKAAESREEDMTSNSVELFTQRVMGKYPEARPMIIHDTECLSNSWISKTEDNAQP